MHFTGCGIKLCPIFFHLYKGTPPRPKQPRRRSLLFIYTCALGLQLIINFIKDIGQIGKDYAVIGHRHALLFCLLHARHDIFAVEHTGATLDHKCIAVQIFGKIGAVYMIDLQILAKAGPKQARQLFTADVLLERNMCAGFCNQDFGALGQRFKRFCAFYKIVNVTLVLCKQGGKEVSMLSFGFCSYTVLNTCESVIISFGGFTRL